MISLIIQFLIIGVLTMGGGLVAIPLLYQAFVVSGKLSESLFYSMLSVSESTPGPIAINLATFIGYESFGILGSVLATYAFVLPSIVVLWTLFPFYKKFKNVIGVKHMMLFLKASILGLVLITILNLFSSLYQESSIFVILAIQLFFFILYPMIKKYPQALLALGAFVGALLLR
jgi:chromate transporter